MYIGVDRLQRYVVCTRRRKWRGVLSRLSRSSRRGGVEIGFGRWRNGHTDIGNVMSQLFEQASDLIFGVPKIRSGLSFCWGRLML